MELLCTNRRIDRTQPKKSEDLHLPHPLPYIILSNSLKATIA